jgi:hypothetical protein
VAGFIGEPIQGVGGFITPPKEYFQIVEKIVRNHGGIFISDEVQTGWGRTGGKWFGIEHWGVTPDIITGAKGFGNGSPIGLTVAKPEVADSVKGLTISTFGGNPGDLHRRQGRDRLHRRKNLLGQLRPRPAPICAGLEELQEKHAHRRRARHGAAAGHRTGGRSPDQSARGGATAAADGSRAREPPAARQGRHVRQRAALSPPMNVGRATWTVHRHCWIRPGRVRAHGRGACGDTRARRRSAQPPERFRAASGARFAIRGGEANRCLFCFDAPCTGACPTHIDVPRFIKKISSGNLRGSALTILTPTFWG